MHFFLHFGTFDLKVLQLILASKLSELEQFENFSAKINCNTIRQNVPKWGKICTGLKFDLVHFNGPQTKFKNIDNFEGPCSYNSSSWSLFSSIKYIGPGVLLIVAWRIDIVQGPSKLSMFLNFV